MFDSTKSGRIEKEKVRTILNTLGHTFDDHELEVLLKQEDEEGIHRTLLSSPLFFFFFHEKTFSIEFHSNYYYYFFFFWNDLLDARRGSIGFVRANEAKQ